MASDFEEPTRTRETIPQRELAFAFIKPDFFDDLPEIEKILNEHGLKIIYKDKLRLSEMQIDEIYKEARDEHFYPAMKKYLTGHDIIALLVGGDGVEAQKVLASLKKSGDKDGIAREKFQKETRLGPEELAAWEKGEHPKQDEVSVILTQRNVIHASDTNEEAVKNLRMLFGKKFETMQGKGNLPSELWDIFKENPEKTQG